MEDRRREHLRVHIRDNHDVRKSKKRRDASAVDRPVWEHRQAGPDEAGAAGQLCNGDSSQRKATNRTATSSTSGTSPCRPRRMRAVGAGVYCLPARRGPPDFASGRGRQLVVWECGVDQRQWEGRASASSASGRRFGWGAHTSHRASRSMLRVHAGRACLRHLYFVSGAPPVVAAWASSPGRAASRAAAAPSRAARPAERGSPAAHCAGQHKFAGAGRRRECARTSPSHTRDESVRAPSTTRPPPARQPRPRPARGALVRGSPSEMLDKLLPPKLKKKPKKLQRQATFLDKPKEAFKKKVRPGLLGAGHVLFVRGHLWDLPGPDLREQVEVLHLVVSRKSVNRRRVAPQKVLREHGDVRGLAVVG